MLLPLRVASLFHQEDLLRRRALLIVGSDPELQAHLRIAEAVMDICDVWRQFETSDEDQKVTQIFGMRIFNAFGACMRLALHGYHQNAAIILRDILEMTALLSLFARDKSHVAKWRENQAKERPDPRLYSPIKVRLMLEEWEKLELPEKQAQWKGERRQNRYKMLSELAAHVSMKSDLMMRPQIEGDAYIGPFIEKGTLTSIVQEIGVCAGEVGITLRQFVPAQWTRGAEARLFFIHEFEQWMRQVYPQNNFSMSWA